ncbi:MAG: S49 family peptidase [Gammaproteobacteria bacterium]
MPNWNEILTEHNQLIKQHENAIISVSDTIRRKYLQELFGFTNRNVICYYSGWLSKPYSQEMSITDEDKNGLMMAVHQMDRSLGLDLILHTPGGSLAASQSLIDYLHRMFGNNIRAIVPQISMSAGTIMSCSCKSIVMGKQSNLGPIDPQINGTSAYSILDEFQQAYDEMKTDQARALIWHPILNKYAIGFFKTVEDTVKLANDFVQKQLVTCMFEGETDAEEKARHITDKLSAIDTNRQHDRHIHIDECKELGLKIEDLEANSELQDLVLTVHHCFMHTIMNTSAYKLIENHNGVALVKHFNNPAR